VFTFFDRRLFLLYAPIAGGTSVIRLRYEREERGLSQSALAQISKVPQPLISLAEAGKWNLSAEDLDALAKALGVQPPAALVKTVQIVVEQHA
jgi:transcriptional regulator with XRE-family HTH domain